MKNYFIVIVTLLLSVTMMAIGYARLSGLLDLNGGATIAGKWDVKITGIEEYEKVGNAKSMSAPTFTSLSANFNVELNNVQDSMKYKIIVKNEGNIDAKLNGVHIVPEPNETDVILYSVDNLYNDEILRVNETKEFYVTVKYNATTPQPPQNKTILISLEYVQND